MILETIDHKDRMGAYAHVAMKKPEKMTKELLRQLIFSNEIQQSAVVIAKEHLKQEFSTESFAGRLSEKAMPMRYVNC